MLSVILILVLIWVVLSGVTVILLCAASSKFSQTEENGTTSNRPQIAYKSSKPARLPAGQMHGEAKTP